MSIVRERIVNQINAKACLEFPFNFLGNIAHESSLEGAEIKRLAIANGKKFCSAVLTKKLFKACDKDLQYGTLDKSHPVYKFIEGVLDRDGKFMEGEVWDRDGSCKDESLLICAVDKNDLTDSCPWNKTLSGSIGESCDCTT